jgi:hypothetical protein
MDYLKISYCVHARKRRVESFEKMSREGKIKRKYEYGKERKK